MADDAMVKIMQSLGLDYNPAIQATKLFEARIASLNQQLFQMKANALQGARDINQAFSSQLGGAGSIASINAQYSQGGIILDQYGGILKKVKGVQEEIADMGDKPIKPPKIPVPDDKKFNAWASEWQRRMSWFITGTAFYGTIRAAQEAVQTMSEVEMGVTEIARVMEDSSFVFKDYRDELLQLGVDYGQTFGTVQDIAMRWAQAGYNVKDSLENTKTSLLALNTAELDASTATESLIGIMAQWNLTAQDLPLVLDKINKTADDYTVTSQDLVDGLLRSSGAAKIMGLSLDQTIALLTTMREASGRTGREVGNALNSILSYIQRASSIKTLEGLGIQVFSDATRTQFRNVMDIFQDIAAKWPTLSAEIQDGFVKAADDAGLYNEELANAIGVQEEWNDLQQRDIAQSAAGVYRRNYFIGMIERLSQAQEVLNNMTDAAGYSQAENARTMDTLAKKYESLKTATQQLAVALGDAGLLNILKGLTDTATNAASSFAKMDDNTKALVLTVLELVAAVSSLHGVVSLFVKGGLAKLALMLPVWGRIAAAIAAATAAIGLYVYNMNKANAQTLQDINAKQQEIEQTNNLISSYESLAGKTNQTSEVKSQLLDIQKQLASIYPEYVDAIDEEGNKLVTNIPLLKEMIALKQQELDLERQKAAQEAQIKLPQLANEQKKLESQLKSLQEKLKKGYVEGTFEYGMGGKIEVGGTEQVLKDIQVVTQRLSEVKLERSSAEQLIKSIQGLTPAEEQELLRQRMRTETSATGGGAGTGYGGGAATGTGAGAAITSGVNEALQNALRVLNYQKHLNQISIEDEIARLKQIKALYAKSADEQMDLDEQIYDAEKELKDKRLQDSINWINEQKELGKLSTEEEIAAWNRVLTNQKDNIEAVKEATLNLYKLQQQAAEDSFSAQEDEIQHWAKLGVFSVQQQIDAYEKLYSLKSDSIEDEYKKTEKLFDLYKDLLSEQQKEIEDAYNKRIEQIDEEAEKKKAAQQEIIDGIQEELDLLDRQESEYDYEQNLASLKEQLAYWSVRTSEEARQKVADINKQIDEAEHDREVELQRQKLEDKKQTAEDEIDAIEEAANKEKEKWEKSYKLVEKAFDEHSINIIAAAGAMAEGAYQQWEEKYLIPLKEALESGDLEEFEGTSSSLEGSTSSMEENQKIYSLASQILSLKKQYEYGGDTSAGKRAEQYYDQLEELSAKGKSIAEQLHAANYIRSQDIVANLPRSHEGSKVLSYGAAYLAPGELIFPPSLSTKLEDLISALYTRPVQTQSIMSTDNRRQISLNGPLLNVENMNMEDEIDGEILSKELRRAVLAL